MNDPIALILIAVICLLIGFASGGLWSSLRNPSNHAARPPTPDAKEQFRVWLDDRNGDLFVQIGQQFIGSPKGLNTGQRMKLNQLLGETRAWLDPYPARRPAQTPVSSTSPPILPLKPEESFQRPSINPVDVLARAIQADVPNVSTNKSFVAQVDEILQEKLENSPLKERAIRLMEFPGKGMVVMVGMNQYNGVDEVPDKDIRALIKSCAAEWERRYSSA